MDRRMVNLLEETRRSIEKSGHTPSDIIFIGSQDGKYSCTWDEFSKLADREYDNGFGGNEVASDLIIVFADKQQMWRGEYDGSEWWEYATPFKSSYITKPIVSLFHHGLLGDINDKGVE